MVSKMEKLKNYKNDFELGDTVWVNCSHQGPLPKSAIKAIEKATDLKKNPSNLDDSLFKDVPNNLKLKLAQLVNASSNNIILGNSATYFVHLLAEGIPWKKGDEIIVTKGDFPTNILSWLPLQK